MPNPKLGTVTPDVGRAVEEQKSGKVEYRVDKNGIVHCAVGKRSFEVDQLVGNTAALMDAILKAKPASEQGHVCQEDRRLHHDGAGVQGGPGCGRRPAVGISKEGVAAC